MKLRLYRMAFTASVVAVFLRGPRRGDEVELIAPRDPIPLRTQLGGKRMNARNGRKW